MKFQKVVFCVTYLCSALVAQAAVTTGINSIQVSCQEIYSDDVQKLKLTSQNIKTPDVDIDSDGIRKKLNNREKHTINAKNTDKYSFLYGLEKFYNSAFFENFWLYVEMISIIKYYTSN